MTYTTLLPVKTPNGKTVVVSVTKLDGTAKGGGEEQAAAGLPSLSDAWAAVDDFTAGLRTALRAVAPHKTTVEFSISFAMKAGRLTTLFVDGSAEGAVTVTLEWGKD